ncbi:MAG: dTMP kinase [Candidatus Spechtbacteria bacterium]|nr:dTMP kinase [Candidatus Spechtbacteria bacterium]
MIKNPYPGKFIVFEGLDGSGSTTQSAKLHQYLMSEKKRSHMTKEPTNYLIGGLIRSWLSGDWESSPVCLQLLFTADRAHHLEKEVIPLLEKGIHVISDRYFLSTMAYGALEIPDRKWLTEINKHFPEPDLTVLLKVTPRTCMKRITENRNHFELFEKERELERVWTNYEYFAKSFPRVAIVDGERDIEVIFKEVQRLALKVISSAA